MCFFIYELNKKTSIKTKNKFISTNQDQETNTNQPII